MAKGFNKNERQARRQRRVRRRTVGTQERPRLAISRSLKHIYAQVIDDSSGRTLASASTVALKVSGSNLDGAKQVGKEIAEKAQAASVKKVTFDRGGRLYHGRIKALADAAREAGLDF